jgi:elongation factor G-like protein
MRGIAAGIVEGLLSHHYPYRGCRVILIAIGWDDVSSSEVAFYRAARAAMEELRTADAWELVSASI